MKSKRKDAKMDTFPPKKLPNIGGNRKNKYFFYTTA